MSNAQMRPGPWRLPARLATGLTGLLGALLAACAQGPHTPHGGLSGPAGSSAEALYQRACATCHEGGAVQAPRREALASLSREQIRASLTTGLMASQGGSLTDEEREDLAVYLSRPQTSAANASSGCAAPDELSYEGRGVNDWGMTPENTRTVSSDRTSLNAGNVSRLRLAWVFAFPGATRARVQPTIAGDVLFTADQFGKVYALGAETGCLLWTLQSDQEIRSSLIVGTDAAGRPDALYFGDITGHVHAIDLATRQIMWSVRPDDHPQATITGAMRLHEGRLYVPISSLEVVAAMDATYPCCTFRGAVAAIDARTGGTVWKTYTISEKPRVQGRNSAGAQMFGPSGAPVWSTPTIDAKRGRLYIGTGENYSHPATGSSDAIMALDLASGRVEWTFQATANDVWNAACPSGPNCPANTGPDFDFGAAPVLVERSGAGGVIIAGQKSGNVYGLDPDKGGALLWTAKPGRGGIMGGVHWGMTTDGDTVFVPVSDISVYPEDAHLPARSGLHALNVATGQALWSTVLPDTCNGAPWRCSPGLSAAVTLGPGVVFGGSLDGMLRAFSAREGAVLWTFDTRRQFEGVNGISGSGGSIDSSGPVVLGRYIYANSGYDRFGQKEGNLLLAFRMDD